MTIQQVADELIEAKDRARAAEIEYTRKRDEMYNLLATQPENRFEHSGFRFIRTAGSTVISMSKDSVIAALRAEDLPEEVLRRIIGVALVETERSEGIRILQITQ